MQAVLGKTHISAQTVITVFVIKRQIENFQIFLVIFVISSTLRIYHCKKYYGIYYVGCVTQNPNNTVWLHLLFFLIILGVWPNVL
jgi:hypothetical protein